VIHITSYLHRDILDDIIRRWMQGDVRPGDEESIAQLIKFNNLYVVRYLKLLAENIFQESHGKMIFRNISSKGDLKDMLVKNPSYRNERIDFLIGEYLRRPGCFYRETPFHGVLISRQDKNSLYFVSSYRIKRVRRLAEKTARRIVDSVFFAIQTNAEALADERAKHFGIPRHELITSPEEMSLEFQQAEETFLDDLRNRRQVEALEKIVINDVGGMKIVWEEASLDPLYESLARAGCEITEQEEHRGRYNAINLAVRYRPPCEQILALPVQGHVLQFLQGKGWDEATVNRSFAEFVTKGEDSVQLEIIVSTFQELLESEIGRCMHEDRIMEQRAERPYRGHLARNIGYLLEYLFTLPEAPAPVGRALPFRLWDRYLPDTFFEVMKGLLGVPSWDVFE